jgi:1L-myo-inositol 1-phosphate cytidylyltransferase / CDP-L-myo-inositol myo-inositolphosphotransferase
VRATGLLLIVPAERTAPSPATWVAGLPLVRRIALAGARAGLTPVLTGGLDAASLVADGTAVDLARAAPSGSPGIMRIVVCPANVIGQTRWLRALAETPLEPETLYVDPAMVAVVETEDSGKVLAEAALAASASALIAALGDRLRRVTASFDPRGRFPISRPADVGLAETWLLRSLVKDSEGFMSRHFERRVSLAITRRLAGTGITPNAMTLISLTVGLSSAPFFLSAAPAWQVVGALMFLTHSILDGCDGELARLKFLESPRGAMLDFWGDNVVHVAVFGCMAVGWSLASGSALPLLLGLAAIGAVGVASAVLSGTGMQPRPPGSEATAKVVDALANRDFIYLVLGLAAIGRSWWFIALVAVGTPIFVLAALWANRGRPAA